MTIDVAFAFMGGVLGAAHCLGMCGPLVIALSSPRIENQVPNSRRVWHSMLGRQLLFCAGRIFTYATLGTLAGFAGSRASSATTAMTVMALLSIAAGLTLVFQGVLGGGLGKHPASWTRSVRSRVGDGFAWLRRRARWLLLPKLVQPTNEPELAQGFERRSISCSMSTVFATFLHGPSRMHALLAGVMTGALPCGLVYGFLALAASKANPLQSLLVMTAFGIGTVPMLVALGCGAARLSGKTRLSLYRIAAAAVIVTGLIALARGVSYLAVDPTVSGTAPCPLCH